MKKIEVVAAIIKDGDKILATQRGYGEFAGSWEFPGGKMEEGESREDALCREIKEELEVDIKVDDYLLTIEYDYPNFHLTMHCYFCHVVEGVINFVEHTSGRWLEKGELDTVKWLPADLDVVEKLMGVL
ncbi:(deoxy)nucleoside triphosphate pyrophosphohydrolase [Mobilitalea sibirica]|uniref:8-oxo-dGTP diphosphatase n=1 Tax=Mobilitalea sibirica TaxID=1462919 RepID=A0A8J7H7A7_9FIRM|nr:(deoxy)nucleoside triphosphate pyrophosphohydrolase [Mobilitalea sibirica]MBH1941056.1 (deoxy)nucleoside triphosphate pyrophosphohydrolase [Mobilitalea sibirica]